MKTVKNRRGRLHHYVPFGVHLLELCVGILIFTTGQNFWAVLVGADPDITPPSVPVNLHSTGQSAVAIDLAWDASTDNVAVSGYHVYRNGNLVATPTGTTLNDAGLTPNTSYTYSVSAFDAATNESAQSATLTLSTLADTSPPSTPVNLHQTGQTVSTVAIAWNASADNVGVTSYNIFRNGSLVRNQAGTSFTDTGLAVYSAYNYNVVALDAASNASNLSSTLVAATAPDTAPPSVPDNIRETGQTISTISLAWDASTDNVGVTGYRVYRNGSLVGSPGGTTFTDTGLSVGTSYTYNITAYDAANNTSAQSAPFSASSSTDTTPPTIPSNVHTTSVQDNAVSLAWTASTDDVGVTGYKIYRDAALVGTSIGTAFTDTGLQPVTNYTYTVKAYDAANNTSSASANVGVTTAFDTTNPTVPTNLHSTAQTDTSITLAWNAATDNIAVSGYDLYRNGTLITSTTSTSYTDSGLSVQTAYSYTVRSHDGSGNNSAQSSALNVSTLADLVAPTAPTGLASSVQTTTSIDLSWNSGTDDVGVSGYHVYRNGSLVATVSGTTYTNSGLQYNTSYSYTIRTVDDSNNESVSSSALSISTLPDTTLPTVALTAPSNGQTLSLTFPVTATASDDLSLNRVEFYADGALIATITSAPFGLNWNSYAVHNGARTITAKAIDTTGNYATSAVTISINNPPPPIVGDINGDHKVNLYDLSILLSRWKKAGVGDFNNSGRVDIFDLSVLLSHYRQDNSGYN